MTIKTCSEIHRMLWYTENLAVAQAYGLSPRDHELLVALAHKLGIPDFKFITSSESETITAQQYLMAMLDIMEPLSRMFQDIWSYCERTLIRTSKNALDIEWKFNFHGQQVEIDFESFRKYRKLLGNVPDKYKFNKLCLEFANACRGYNTDRRHDWRDPMPSKPYHAESESVASKVYDLCKSVKNEGLIDKGYFGATDAIPSLCSIINCSVWGTEDFSELKSLIDDFNNQIEPEDILSLPFWKYRWQIYELWCLITTLQLFEPRGFELIQSANGASLLELGHTVVVAQRKEPPLGQIIYQPSYNRRSGQGVHPDIVVVHGHPDTVRPSDVCAIVECKQHRMPEDENLMRLKKRYFDKVAESYEDSISPGGKMILVNYDQADFERNYVLLDDFKPGNVSQLKSSLASLLDEFSVVENPRQVVLIVDGSGSMSDVQIDLKEHIKDLIKTLGASKDIVWLVGNRVEVRNIDDFKSSSFHGSESFDLFLNGIYRAEQFYPLVNIHIITDLEPTSSLLDEVKRYYGTLLHMHYVS